jgi:hypothetical protein
MKLPVVAAVVLAAVQTYPAPFPREGTTKVLENDRVVVWRLDWTRGRPTAMHEHTMDLVAVVLAGGRVTSAPPGRAVQVRDLTRGAALFQPRGMIHVEELLEPATAQSISIELKNVAAPARSPDTSAPEGFPREGARLVVENERVALWDYTWRADRPVARHVHNCDTVVVPVDAGEIRVEFAGGDTRISRLMPGEALYFSGAEPHSEQAVVGTPRAIVVELK